MGERDYCKMDKQTDKREMNYKRIVLKIGTSLLTGREGLPGLRTDFIDGIAKQVTELRKKGADVLIVTSGAIGAGCRELGIKKSREIEVRQALAACGQSVVMGAYHNAFSKHGMKVAQILLTYEDFSNRKRYLYLRKAISKLLSFGVIPVINENDVISVDEIGATFGDNDKLSALVASKVNADLLIILSDIDGLYDKNPKTNKDAKLIKRVGSITRDIERAAGSSGSLFAIGGMAAKIKAAKIALESGFDMVICNGKNKDILRKAISGDEGTFFAAGEKLNRLSNKERWIKFSRAEGKLIIDRGAEEALRRGKSLLSVGIKDIEGEFDKNSVVEIGAGAVGVVAKNSKVGGGVVESSGIVSVAKTRGTITYIAKGISDYSSKEIETIKGRKGVVVVKSGNVVF